MDEAIKHGVWDWVTLGLIWRQKLLSSCSVDEVVPVVFIPTAAYHIQHRPPGGRGRSILKVMSDASQPCLTKWDILKKYAAAIRYSFLTSTTIELVSVEIDTEGLLSNSVILRAANKELVLSSDAGRIDGNNDGQIVLQGGHPAHWFDILRWQQLRPFAEHGASHAEYPLSQPSYCESRFDAALVGIGAHRIRASFWAPPPGTANDDMHDYLRSTAGQGRSAA